jgi:peptide-methionine (S)-S-oxide reductase
MKGLICLMILVSSFRAFAEKAVFAGGCFWCMETPFEDISGVSEVKAGYIGGERSTARYEKVSQGSTGHVEAVEVTFDPDEISYEKLLEVYWKNVNPLDGGGQFCDRGSQYRSAIFPLTPQQKKLATASLQSVKDDPRFKNKEIKTQVEPAGSFYPAEEYHQDYSKKNPIRYKYYKFTCGREKTLKNLWEGES